MAMLLASVLIVTPHWLRLLRRIIA